MNKFRMAFLLLIIAAIAFSAGCGKTGDPRPRENTRSFAWQELRVAPAGACLDISAVMSGVYSNLDSVLLEFADISEGDCPGCPFIVKEQIEIKDLNKLFDQSKGELRFSHCPRIKAPGYRLRLVGVNIYDTSRHAVSPVKYVEIPR